MKSQLLPSQTKLAALQQKSFPLARTWKSRAQSAGQTLFRIQQKYAGATSKLDIDENTFLDVMS